ncbi:MAG: hypothetical protein EA393_03635 [Bacteroidetes bacterium]|nr:MAG: hypothetical protein EA393_03635 [Bacteroidota bacterium]
MKAKYFTIILAFLFPALLFAQELPAEQPELLNDDYSLFNARPAFGMQVGSTFSTGFGGNMFTQSFAPHLQFQPGQNFSLIVGTIFSTSNISGGSPMFMNASGAEIPNRFLSNTVYAFGAYQINPRLTITGGAWTEQNNFNMMHNQMNPQAFDMNARGMMMGMDLRITENLRFGAQVSISRGYNPFNPYSRGFGQYNNNPFHRRYPW